MFVCAWDVAAHAIPLAAAKGLRASVRCRGTVARAGPPPRAGAARPTGCARAPSHTSELTSPYSMSHHPVAPPACLDARVPVKVLFRLIEGVLCKNVCVIIIVCLPF